MNDYIETKPLFFNPEKLIKQPQIMYRSQIGGMRFYYSVVDGMFKSYPSVTTIIDAEMKQPEWLIKWIAEWGYKRALQKRDEAADYGTLFTICAAQFLKDRRFDLESLKPRLEVYTSINKINYPVDLWEYKLREDLYALHQFIIDYEVEPLAVEVVLASEKGFAGAVDAVVEMTVGTGVNMRILKADRKYDKKTGELLEDKTRRVTAIIDWKTGRHGFYRNNEAQLHFYKVLWEENFPHLPIDAIFNWSPKEWSTDSDSLYNLKEQSGSKEAAKIFNYLNNFLIENAGKGNRPYKVIEGVLEYGRQNGNLRVETIQDRMTAVKNEPKKEPEPEIDTPKQPTTYKENLGVEKDAKAQEIPPRNPLLDQTLKNYQQTNSILDTIEDIINK